MSKNKPTLHDQIPYEVTARLTPAQYEWLLWAVDYTISNLVGAKPPVLKAAQVMAMRRARNNLSTGWDQAVAERDK